MLGYPITQWYWRTSRLYCTWKNSLLSLPYSSLLRPVTRPCSIPVDARVHLPTSHNVASNSLNAAVQPVSWRSANGSISFPKVKQPFPSSPVSRSGHGSWMQGFLHAVPPELSSCRYLRVRFRVDQETKRISTSPLVIDKRLDSSQSNR